MFLVFFFLWVIRVAGCLLGLTDSKAACYVWDQWEDSLLSYTGSPNLSTYKIS